MPQPGWVVAVLVLAAWRMAWLIAKDRVTMPLRERVYDFAWRAPDVAPVRGPDDDQPVTMIPRAAWRTWLFELVRCPLCVGIYASAIVYACWRWGDVPGRAFVVILGVAGGQALLTFPALLAAKALDEDED